MEYGIRELSGIAGVSARTLRYYDEIGLLKPSHVTEAGYRFYGEREVACLQQILFYRERGLDLKRIQNILYQDDFDILKALEEHLQDLRDQRGHVDSLIRTVEQTIASMKGECEMSDQEKFEALKKTAIEENEKVYGNEIRRKYGEEAVDASYGKIRGMSQQEWEDFRQMEKDILARLQAAVQQGLDPEGAEGRQIAELHKKWLCRTWKQYSAQAHIGVAEMYTADERFKGYYDKDVTGCAEWLRSAIQFWAEKL